MLLPSRSRRRVSSPRAAAACADDSVRGSSVSVNALPFARRRALHHLAPVVIIRAGQRSVERRRQLTVAVSDETTPPVISNVTTSAITASGATIGWTTNEASDSQALYHRTR